jgi:hypothetical protein
MYKIEHKRMAKVLTNDLRHLNERGFRVRLLTLNHERDNNRDDRNRLN